MFSNEKITFKENKIVSSQKEEVILTEDFYSNKTIAELNFGRMKIKAKDTNYIALAFLSTKPDYIGDVSNLKKQEIRYQISLVLESMINIYKDYNFYLSGSYTQTTNWQQFLNSSPFRETVYKPELYLTFPLKKPLSYNQIYFSKITMGFMHMSNGRSSYQQASKSWNSIYLKTSFQYKRLFVDLKNIIRIPENPETDDNPDIDKYYGNTEISLDYVYNRSNFKFTIRKDIKNLFTKKSGSVELSYTYPINRRHSLFFYSSIFHGYAYDLTNYRNKLTAFNIGISFSR